MTAPKWPQLVAIPVLAAVSTPASATDYLSVADAQRVLFPQAQSFVPLPVTLSPAQLAQIRKMAGTPQRNAQPRIWRAVSGGATLGWFLVDQVIGKHEMITYAAALSPDGHVLGIEVMTYKETKGDQVREARWRAKFKGKTLADPFKLEKDIPNISGATLSCRNITDGVKRLLAIHATILSRA